MERLESVNIDRISWCCADRGIAPLELADELNISHASMSKIMSGEQGPTFKQLSDIASFFGRGVLFFLEDAPITVQNIQTPQFRSLSRQKPELSPKMKALINRVEKQRDLFVSLREDVEGDLLPQFRHPKLDKLDIKQAATKVRSWLGLDLKTKSFDTYRSSIEKKGILVFKASGYNGKWQIAKESPIIGFAIYDENCPVIVVKKKHSDTQLAFTLMHELGHLLLHKESSIDEESDIYALAKNEREANRFAGCVLVPDEELLTVSDERRPNDVSDYDAWLNPIHKRLAVSTEVILRRLMDEDRLTSKLYNEYRAWRSKLPIPEADSGTRMYRHREPKHLFGDAFVRTVLDALNSRHITLSKASDYLDRLKVKDIRELERHYAGS